jgi:hypothetical protein
MRTDPMIRGLAAACAAAVALAVLVPAAGAFPAPRPGLEIALSGGRPWLPEAPAGYPDYYDDKVAAGYAAGGTLEWKLRGPFRLATGLRYSLDTERSDFEVDFGGGARISGIDRVRLHRLGVPLRLRLPLPFLRGLSAEAGAETQYLLLARRDDETQFDYGIIFLGARPPRDVARPSAIIFEGYTGQDDVTGHYPRWNLALGGGLGWEFPLGRVTGALRGRYQQGVSDQTKTPYAKDFSRVAELGLGIQW